MIISHRYKFIFIKTSKSAGTSIEIALSEFCDENDVVTPISSGDEKIRKELGFCGPQNCYVPLAGCRLNDVARLVFKGKRKLAFYNHMPATEIRAKIGEEIWNEYFKFCFVRNPWDRVISLYYHRYKTEPRPPLRKFINNEVMDSLKKYGTDLYRINGAVAVDKVYSYEEMMEGLDEVAELLKLPKRLRLVNAKGGLSGRQSRI